MPSVTAIIPNWNRRDLLERLLATLSGQKQPFQEIVVVDNGSTDGSAETAAAKGARVIRLSENSGFARAVNRGIGEAKTPWLVVLNNDVELSPDWLARLMESVSKSGVWFGTGRLLNAVRPDIIDGTYDVLCRGGCAWRAGCGRPDGPVWARPRSIHFAPFTAALFRSELFQKVGLLDERFESYLEDVDFGLRCALRGYAGVYVPEAMAYHAGSATLGPWHADAVRRTARNQLLLVAKHYPQRWLLRYGWSIIVAHTLWGLVAFRHGRGLPYLRGKLEGLRLFRSLRRAAEHAQDPADADRLAQILEEGEQEIRALQERTGFDLYWKLYLALT